MFKHLLMIVFTFIFIASQGYANSLVLGVLDQPQCKETNGVSARVLFLKQDNEWVALDGFINVLDLDLNVTKWIIAFDGKKIGEIKISDPDPKKKFINPWYHNRDKVFEIPSNQKTPLIQNEAKLFRGWCDVPQYRPLVLVSKPNFADPEGWKSFVPDDEFKKRLYLPLRLTIGRFGALRCPAGPNVNKTEPFDFQPSDLVFYRSYRSSAGKMLIALGLNKAKHGCDGVISPEWRDNWFLVDNENIDFLGREMTLVDAGDYDADGRSELLFWHSGYNKDGYLLIYDSLRKKVEYLWGYH